MKVMVSPADISLFHVAAQQLGDATQWNRIAALNGLTDPAITYTKALEMPGIDPMAGGGIPENSNG